MKLTTAAAKAARLRASPLGRRGRRVLAGAATLAWAAALTRVRGRARVVAAIENPEQAPEKKTKKWLGLIKDAISKGNSDQVTRLGASLAYYTMLSMAPLVLITVAVVGIFLGPNAARGLVADQLKGFLGADKAKAVQDVIAGAQKLGVGATAGLIGFVTLLFGASSVVSELQASLNAIFEVSAAKLGWRATIRGRLISLAFVLGMGFLLLVSLIMSAAISAAGKYLSGLSIPEPVLHLVSIASSAVIIWLLFTAMFRFLPQVRIAWRDAAIGAAVTAALFEIGNFVLGLYLGKGGPTSAYGAAGSLLAFLVWTYYCAQIIYFGAEFTYVYAARRGSGVREL